MMGTCCGGWMAWGVVLGIILIAVVVAAIVYLLLGQRGAVARPQADALAVLRERYARGEIGRSEYEERVGVLGGTGNPPNAGTAS